MNATDRKEKSHVDGLKTRLMRDEESEQNEEGKFFDDNLIWKVTYS